MSKYSLDLCVGYTSHVFRWPLWHVPRNWSCHLGSFLSDEIEETDDMEEQNEQEDKKKRMEQAQEVWVEGVFCLSG